MLALSASVAVAPASAELVSPGGGPLNPANDELLKLPPPERAEKLARAISEWCIGTEAFLMGVIGAGPGRGNAYWSLRCADGTEWAIQIDPEAGITAIGCDEPSSRPPPARNASSNSERSRRRRLPARPAGGTRRTRRPRFCSRHCGSAHFCFTASSESVWPAATSGLSRPQPPAA